MQRCAILIDGSNFYFKLRDLGLHNLLNFDFNKFIKQIAGCNVDLIQATYYVGAIRTTNTKKSQQLLSQQRRLLSHLKKCGLNYFLGYLLKSGSNFHEKGVDVKIAIDILIATYENIVDRIILISSDTDFLPAIEVAKTKGKIIQYIGFKHKPSIAMMNNSSNFRLLSKTDILSFIV